MIVLRFLIADFVICSSGLIICTYVRTVYGCSIKLNFDSHAKIIILIFMDPKVVALVFNEVPFGCQYVHRGEG